MNTLTNIIEIGIWTSVIFSILFVAIRAFVCYFYNPKDYSEGCEADSIIDYCNDLNAMHEAEKMENKTSKPKRTRKAKTPEEPAKKKAARKAKTSTEPAKKKPARKKKES